MNSANLTFKTASAALGLLALFAAQANAVFINGDISFSADGITLNDPIPTATEVLSYDNVIVGAGSGDYAAVLVNTPVTMMPFEFLPTLDPAPLQAFWTFNFMGDIYSFTLNSVTSVEKFSGPSTIAGVTGHTLTIQGEGIASITGFDPTPGFFSMSTQDFGGGASLNPPEGTGVGISFSSNTTVSGVPEGGETAALLGGGLLLLGILRRKLGSFRPANG